MSTQAIREALDWVETYLGNVPKAQVVRRAACAEVEAIEKEATSRAERYEGLWDIVRELMERPCELGSDCRPKVELMHPCLPCAARMEWEAK